MQETAKRESTQRAISGEHGIDLIVLKNINHLFTISRLEEWVPLLKRWFSLASAVGVKVVVLLNADLLPSSKSKYHGISYQAILQDLTQLHVDVDDAPDNGKLTCKLFLKKLSGRVERDEFIYSIDFAGKVSIQESAQESISNQIAAKVASKKEQTVDAVAAATNLTFSLSLSDSQKKQKEDLVLPYTDAAQQVYRDGESTPAPASRPIISYTADKNDDFDSEDDDPDDDLDI